MSGTLRKNRPELVCIGILVGLYIVLKLAAGIMTHTLATSFYAIVSETLTFFFTLGPFIFAVLFAIYVQRKTARTFFAIVLGFIMYAILISFIATLSAAGLINVNYTSRLIKYNWSVTSHDLEDRSGLSTGVGPQPDPNEAPE